MTAVHVLLRALPRDHPQRLERLVVMDNVPTRTVSTQMNAIIAKHYWFFMFHLVPDLPERLISAGRTYGFDISFPIGATTPRRLRAKPLTIMSKLIKCQVRSEVPWPITGLMLKTWRRIMKMRA